MPYGGVGCLWLPGFACSSGFPEPGAALFVFADLFLPIFRGLCCVFWEFEPGQSYLLSLLPLCITELQAQNFFYIPTKKTHNSAYSISILDPDSKEIKKKHLG